MLSDFIAKLFKGEVSREVMTTTAEGKPALRYDEIQVRLDKSNAGVQFLFKNRPSTS